MFAWISRRFCPYLLSAIGGASVTELYSSWQKNASDILALINGSKEFQSINANSQYFLVSVALIVIVCTSYVVAGRIMYERGHCYRTYEKNRQRES